MTARLGRVLYWTACALSALGALWGGYALYIALSGQSAIPADTEFYAAKWLAIAAALWAAGRGARYVLAAE